MITSQGFFLLIAIKYQLFIVMNLFIFYLRKYVRRADLFGQPIMLNYRNKQDYQTLYGGVISLMIIFIASVLLYGQGVALIRRQKFTIFTDELTQINPAQLNITSEMFMFALSIKDSQSRGYKRFFDFKLFQYRIAFDNQGNRKSKITTKEITLEKCTIDHFKKQFIIQSKEFSSFDLKNFQCPPLNLTYGLQGLNSNPIFEYLKIEIVPCEGGIDVCESPSVLQKYVEDNAFFQFRLVTSTYQVMPTQQNSFQIHIQDDTTFQFVPYKVYTRADLYLRSITIDENLSIVPLIDDVRETKLLQLLNQDIRSFLIFDTKYDIFGEFSFKLSPKSNIIKKSYQQVDDYLAYAGGLLKLFIWVIGLLVISYNRYDLCVSLANRLYDFDQQNDKGEHAHELINQRIKCIVSYAINALRTKLSMSQIKRDRCNKILESVQQNKVLSSETPKNKVYERTGTKLQTQNQFLDFVSKELINCRKAITLNLKYLFTRWSFRWFCYQTSHVMLIDTGVSRIKKELDIMKILDRLQTVDRLKEILLDRNQINLLENLEKPIITPKNILIKKRKRRLLKLKLSDLEQFGRLQSMQKLFKAYTKLKEDSARTQSHEQYNLNEKLFEMVTERMRAIFNFTLSLPKAKDKELMKVRFQGNDNESNSNGNSDNGGDMAIVRISCSESDEIEEANPMKVYKSRQIQPNNTHTSEKAPPDNGLPFIPIFSPVQSSMSPVDQ